MNCTHLRARWIGPDVFDLQPALPTYRSWRYAEYWQDCPDCGQRLAAFRFDLRGGSTPGRIYRVVFSDRIREGNLYRIEIPLEGPPAVILGQTAAPGGPVFDVDPPIPCTAVTAAYEDDFPFALVRTRGGWPV